VGQGKLGRSKPWDVEVWEKGICRKEKRIGNDSYPVAK